ncbi:MAG: Aspartate/tyrosine/aromatic aminotransferase [Clostridiales bacterium 38_11]|nr:MAG: Aspartate/tyrosine/aromatic aminotransferase [Clostridiales bacterium 38_11]HBH12023.1 aspartate/tyrosine/aromatic aminotransferase [Clostridiales bacterium]
MKMNDFKLEVYFGKHEFSAPYLLTQSDCQSMSVKELLKLAGESEEGLLDNWLGYTEVPGGIELRQEIAGLYDSIGPDAILAHSGAQEAIFNFMNVMLDRGDHVITMFPTYQSLFEVADAIGCEVDRWHLIQAENQWTIDIDHLKKLIKPNTRLICINTPNNPTGYTLTNEQMNEIAELADREGIYIFSDEVYKGIELDGIERKWFADLYDKAVSLGVMSKAYGLAGLRIGWIATKDKSIIEKMTKFKHYTTICNSSTSEYLATVALKNGKKILDRNLSMIEKNLEISDLFFEKYRNLFQYNRPMCGPIAFHRLKSDISINEFCNQMVEERGILLLPAEIYSYEGNYFRMGYGRLDFENSLERFEEYLISKKIA